MSWPLLIFTNEDGLLCPFFRCATCGERITEAQNAIAVIGRDDHYRYTGEIMAVHKGDCDRYPGEPWRPLDELLSQLAFNSGLEREAPR